MGDHILEKGMDKKNWIKNLKKKGFAIGKLKLNCCDKSAGGGAI